MERRFAVERRFNIELGQLIKYNIRKTFINEYANKLYLKLVPDLYLLLVNSPIVQFLQETLL